MVAILLGKVAIGLPVTVPLLVFLAGQLGLFFISVLAQMNDMPALIASAPVAARAPRRAAYLVCAQTALAIIGLPVVAVLVKAPTLAPAMLLGIGAALASNLWLGRRLPIPLSRAAFGKTQIGTLLGLVLGVSISAGWALAAWLVVEFA